MHNTTHTDAPTQPAASQENPLGTKPDPGEHDPGKDSKPDGAKSPKRKSSHPVTRVLDSIGSIWFGVGCLFAIFVYSWIGSAGLAPLINARESFIRQRFEKTEMAWFSWWPFTVLLVVFCLALTIITLRRIRFNKFNYGVWMVHAGILTLCFGCWVYFGTKIEGDAVVYRREAVIRIGGEEVSRLKIRPNAEVLARAGSVSYQVGVANLNPHYTLLTGEDKGKTAFAITLSIQPFENVRAGNPFMRQLIVGYPEYTEDVIPGQGRAVKVTGEKILDPNLEFELDFAPVDRFFVKDAAALHVRRLGTREWSEYPIPDLPRYKTYLGHLDGVRYPADEKPPTRPLDLVAERTESSPNLDADVEFRIKGYIPYAGLREFFEPGGEQWNPWMRTRFQVATDAPIVHEFLALDPRRSKVELDKGVVASFVWIDDPAELDRFLNPGTPQLVVNIPEADFSQTIELPKMTEPIPLGDTGYSLEYQQFYQDWNLASSGREGESASMLLVKVVSPDRTFTRAVVTPDSSLSQDLDEQGQRHQELLDDRIELELQNVVRSGLTLVSGEVGNHILITSRGGEVIHREAKLAEPVSLFEGNLQITVEDVSPTSRRVIKPDLIPFREQNPKTLPNLSLIQLEIIEPGRSRTEWLEYSHYAHENRIGYFPQTVRLQDGKRIELLYSRETHPLPTPMALEEFQLVQFPGRTRERDYVSLIRFDEEGKWGGVHEVRSNQPTEYEKWWYFQSTWDPPAPRANYAGLNYTGIGVGNRNGVGIMLWGTIMTVIGTLYAFYLKPVLRRRSQAALAARTAAAAGSQPEPSEDSEVPAPSAPS